MAEHATFEMGGLSGPDSAPALEAGVRSARRTLEWLVFAGSVALHVALYLRIHNEATPQVTRFVPSNVEIELAHPPRPEEPKIKEPEPPPEPPSPAEKPISHVASEATVTRAALAVPHNSNLPSSDEGLVPPTPPGTGIPGPAFAPPPTPPPPPSRPPPPAPVIAAREGANYKSNPRPPYPRLAQREEWEGVVVMSVRVAPNGHVASVTITKSAGHSVLDEAAAAAVRNWTFSPATQGGVAIESYATSSIAWKLQ